VAAPGWKPGRGDVHPCGFDPRSFRMTDRIDVDAILAFLDESYPELSNPGEDRWGGANLCCPIHLIERCLLHDPLRRKTMESSDHGGQLVLKTGMAR
jgi:hypothetical protein